MNGVLPQVYRSGKQGDSSTPHATLTLTTTTTTTTPNTIYKLMQGTAGSH